MQVINRLTGVALRWEATNLPIAISQRTMQGGELTMPAEAQCPRCQLTIRVPSNFGGQRVKCPQCQERFMVPLPPPQPPPSKSAIFEDLVQDTLADDDSGYAT